MNFLFGKRWLRYTEKIEPGAFVVMNSVKDTKGGMIKKDHYLIDV